MKLDKLQFLSGKERCGGCLKLVNQPSPSVRRFHVRSEDVTNLLDGRERQEARHDRRVEAPVAATLSADLRQILEDLGLTEDVAVGEE